MQEPTDYRLWSEHNHYYYEHSQRQKQLCIPANARHAIHAYTQQIGASLATGAIEFINQIKPSLEFATEDCTTNICGMRLLRWWSMHPDLAGCIA